MQETPPCARNWKVVSGAFLAIFVLAGLANAQGKNLIQSFYSDLLASYSSEWSPQPGQALRGADRISKASSEDIRTALPAILATVTHRDARIQSFGALAVYAVGERSDGAELLKPYLSSIATLFDSDSRLQLTCAAVLSTMKPAPPAEVVPLLTAFVEKADRDTRAQVHAISALLRVAGPRPEVVRAITTFFSRPVPSAVKADALNALGTPRATDPRLWNIAIQGLGDSSVAVRMTAPQVLRRMGPEALQHATPALEAVINRKGEAAEVKRFVREALQVPSQSR